METSDLILIDRPAPDIARLTLNRPERRNALSIALRDAATERLAALADDPSVKVVVLTGAGAVFSAGFDLKEFQQAADDPAFRARLWESSDRYHETLLTYPLPLVAAVNGPALAGGFDTAVLCDLRMASTQASFGHPETSFGDVVYAPLHDLVGGAAARDLCLTGRTIDAAEALALRLVSRVVAPDDLMAATLETAAAIARAPRPILRRTKAKIVTRAAIPFTATLAL